MDAEERLATLPCGCRYDKRTNIFTYFARGCTEHSTILKSVLVSTYDALFSRSTCGSCHDPIWWVITKNGKRAPLGANGLSHFDECQQAEFWRKKSTDGKAKAAGEGG